MFSNLILKNVGNSQISSLTCPWLIPIEKTRQKVKIIRYEYI